VHTTPSDGNAPTWHPTRKPSLHEVFQFGCTVNGVLWGVYHIRQDDKSGTLACSISNATARDEVVARATVPAVYTSSTWPGHLSRDEVVARLREPGLVVESPHDPLDPYTPEDRKRYNEQTWAYCQKQRDDTGVALFLGPFIGPWIEHSHHRYSRSWHPSLGGGGPAAVVDVRGRCTWFAWHNLGGFKSDVTEKLQEAMAAADAFLAEEDYYVKPNAHYMYYPLAVSLLIEASPWTRESSTSGFVCGTTGELDQWVRTWEALPNQQDKKAIAARIVERDNEFHFVCYGIYSESCIGDGEAADLRTAERLADEVLRVYCQASEQPCR
jgi:hypothetical protein